MLPFLVVALSLVANWVGSENITGLTGEVACSHAVPAILLDPLGAAACLMALGFLLGPFVGRYDTMSDLMVHRFGSTVGGIAAALSLIGSVLWAGAQYKAIISLALGLNVCAAEWLEPTVALGLLSWSIVGGFLADVWLDALSMIVVAPTMMILATLAWKQLPQRVLQAEQVHALAVAPSLAANKFAIGLFGNLFTEELAGRVLAAKSPQQARLACLIACLLFGTIGLAPAILGLWSNYNGLLKTSDGQGSLRVARSSHWSGRSATSAASADR